MRRRWTWCASRRRSDLKSNALIHGMTLWDEVFRDVARDYPDVKTNSLLVDAAAMDLVRKPETFRSEVERPHSRHDPLGRGLPRRGPRLSGREDELAARRCGGDGPGAQAGDVQI